MAGLPQGPLHSGSRTTMWQIGNRAGLMAEGAQSMINLELALESSAWKWWVPFLLISLARANYMAKVNGDEETDQLFPVKVSECSWATVRQDTGAVGTAPLSAEKLYSFFYHFLRREDCCSSGLSWNPEHSVLPGLCCLHLLTIPHSLSWNIQASRPSSFPIF